MTPFSIIVAMDSARGIGKNGTLPWHLKGDLRYFKAITTTTRQADKQNAVIMGRKTWDSLPEHFRPLPGRLNVVVTRNKDLDVPEGVWKASSLQDALTQIGEGGEKSPIESVYVIGGAQIYAQAVQHPQCRQIYLTRIDGAFDCDTFFPEFSGEFKEKKVSDPQKEGPLTYFFAEYARL